MDRAARLEYPHWPAFADDADANWWTPIKGRMGGVVSAEQRRPSSDVELVEIFLYESPATLRGSRASIVISSSLGANLHTVFVRALKRFTFRRVEFTTEFLSSQSKFFFVARL